MIANCKGPGSGGFPRIYSVKNPGSGGDTAGMAGFAASVLGQVGSPGGGARGAGARPKKLEEAGFIFGGSRFPLTRTFHRRLGNRRGQRARLPKRAVRPPCRPVSTVRLDNSKDSKCVSLHALTLRTRHPVPRGPSYSGLFLPGNEKSGWNYR